MKKILMFLSTERSNYAVNYALEECLKLSEDGSICQKSLGSLSVNSLLLKKSVSGVSTNVWQDIEIEYSSHEWKTVSIPKEEEDVLRDGQSQCEIEFRFNDFFKLSEFLHRYADENCELGRDILQIFWCVESYAPCPSEVVEFFGALKRLHIWHNASIAIITKDFSTVKEWDGLFSMQVVDSCLPIVKSGISTCWKGSLSVSFEGRGEEFFPHVFISTESHEKSIFGDTDSYVLPIAEVFNEIDISTIPWTCIRNIYTISISSDILAEPRDCLKEILRLASQTTGVGTLIRIRHSLNPPTVSNLKSLTTDTWKQNITDGNFNLRPLMSFDMTHQCTVLMILNEGRMDDKVFAVALQGANECGEEISKMLLEESLKPRVEEDCPEKEKVYNLIRETKLISNVEVAALSHLLRNLPAKVKKMIIKKTDIDKLSPDMKGTWEKICNEEISNVVFAKSSKDSNFVPVPSPDAVLFSPEISQPMENWPEYIALSELEIGNKSSLKRSSSSDLLHGLQPPVAKPKGLFLDDTEILRVFDKNGKAAKNVLKNMTKYDKRGVSYFKGWGKRGSNIPWQKALHSNIHGICYNSNEEKERFELSSNRTRDRHIINETVSTCSSFKHKEFRLSQRRSGLQKRLAPLSDIDSDTVSDVTSTRTASTVPVYPELKGTSSIMTESRTSRLLKKDKGTKKDLSSILKETQEKRKSLEMLDPNADLRSFNMGSRDNSLRRSPRKHSSRGLKPSDLLKPNIENKIVRHKHYSHSRDSKHHPKPADLSDLHKIKLRNAIKTVLDSEDVSMKNPLFKQCFKKLFAVCRPFALDVIGLGATSRNMEKIAQSHVKQVIEFEKLKKRKR